MGGLIEWSTSEVPSNSKGPPLTDDECTCPSCRETNPDQDRSDTAERL